MAAAGVPLRTLQEWLGHRDITTTQRYADYAPSEHDGEMVEAAFCTPSRTSISSPRCCGSLRSPSALTINRLSGS